MKYQLGFFLLAAVSVSVDVSVHVDAFTYPITNHHRHRLSSLKASSSSSSSSSDLSGGVFFDGPTDFKVSGNSPIQKATSNAKQSSNRNANMNVNVNPKTIPKDIVIIGAGLAGLSTALHISMNSHKYNTNSNSNTNNSNSNSPPRQITILEKEDPTQQLKKTTAGSFAAAGMLAPQSERLPSGPLLDLCLESRECYSDFVALVEGLVRGCSVDASRFLWRDVNRDDHDGNGNKGEDGLEPWEVGYTATGGFLAPAFAGDSVATWSPPSASSTTGTGTGTGTGTAKWLDEIQVHEMEPCLHPDVIGGWWFPEDASVDARRLTCALRAACVERGVQFMYGDGCAAKSLELGGGTCKGIKLEDGRTLTANSVVVANGAWMRNLLPVPITPHKGQSFSLRMPSGKNDEPILSRVLFAQDTYIVPKADGRIVIGATVEPGSFDPNLTPNGLMHCMANAIQLVPGLGDLPLEETWAGLRPTTPDKGPILGRTSWDNLFLAGGYWRNGVLLAPKTGQLIGDLVLNGGKPLEDENDELYLHAFRWDRFMEEGGGKKLAADTRYAASMHPVHKRATGMGVAAAVGTELGFYSGAGDAVQERKKDRDMLFQDMGDVAGAGAGAGAGIGGGMSMGLGMSGNEENAFEKAAMQGLTDATAFSSFKVDNPKRTPPAIEDVTLDAAANDPYLDYSSEGSNSDGDGDGDSDLVSETVPYDGSPDALTVGAGSVPEDMKEEISIIENADSNTNTNAPNDVEAVKIMDVDESKSVAKAEGQKVELPESMSDYDEKTFDGYQTIQQANSRQSREEELKLMKEARIKNRQKASTIDPSKIGVQQMEFPQNVPAPASIPTPTPVPESNAEDLSEIYSAIKANKEAASSSTTKRMQEEGSKVDERPDPGFRVYHVDSVTREETEIPPYTSPQSILNEKKAAVEDTDSSEPWGE